MDNDIRPAVTSTPPTASVPSQPVSPTPATPPPVNPKKSKKKLYLIIVLLVSALAAGYWHWSQSSNDKAATTNRPVTTKSQQKLPGLQLDEKKNYGNKYANGVLPVGDGKYQSDTAKAGYVFTCAQYANNLKSTNGGAGTRGPWFTNNNTQYDLNKKLRVQGNVTWQPSFSNTVNGANRSITTNDLPSHPTGVFPISPKDPAYAYDRNPHTLKAQTFSYALNASPTYGAPQCMGGQAGVMLTGVALFNGFDAGGRDAGAWEVQDTCDGHPEKEGAYHYHTLSSCIQDTSVKTVIGFALDGFPITGPKVGDSNILTTADLDECHGLTSQVTLDTKTKTTYHYVMTQDFPYSVSCFRATPANPPGQPAKP